MFWERHTGRPLCSDLMIEHIILPQIGFAQDKIKNNAIQGDHCVLETPYRETIVFGSHNQKDYAASDWLGPGQDPKSRVDDHGQHFRVDDSWERPIQSMTPTIPSFLLLLFYFP